MPASMKNDCTSITEIFKKTAIFSALPDADLAILANHSGCYGYRKGELVFEKGSSSRNLFIIESGEVAIVSRLDSSSRDGDQGGGREIARFIAGEIFGEFEFFEGDTRTAFAVAGEDSTLLTFPGEGVDLEHLFDEYAHIFAKVYHRLISVNAGRQRLTHRLISEKTGWIEELKKQMFFDKLTGVYNRTYLEDELARNFAHLGQVWSLLVIKPDNFKLINDTFGHEAGDSALQAISSKLQSLLRGHDFAVRYRGNEFIVVFPATTIDEASALAGSYLEQMNGFDIGIAMKRDSLLQTFSIGVASYPEHEKTVLDLVEKAFTKVFEQREAGGNGVRVASAGEDELNNFLRTVGILSSLKMSELHQLTQYLDTVHYAEGGVIFRAREDGNEKEIAVLKSGEFFGEMAIFENAPRSATCIAAEECEMLRLHKDDFFNLMKTSPHTAINIMKNMLNKTTDRLNASGQFITQMVKWGEDASLRAVTDKLSGVFNRRYLESELEKRFNLAVKENTSLCLVMADMDFFREVNEGYSHEVGDQYIVEVAKVFKTAFRETDIVSRYGGDEFTILLPNTDLATGMAVTEEVRKAVERLDFLKAIPGPDLHLSVSLGVSCYPATSSAIKELTEHADKALYAAKHAGKNRVEHAPLIEQKS